MNTTKYVYFFGTSGTEGSTKMRNLLGGKGADLAEMTNIGIPVPAGFTITTQACVEYFQKGNKVPDGLYDQVKEALNKLEKEMGARFGDPSNPLFVSVRSGARVSMPGMMDTVLNLGSNQDTIQGLITRSGNERFAYDTYRRFINMFGNVVLGVEHDEFEEIMRKIKAEKGVSADLDLDAEDLKKLCSEYRKLVEKHTAKPFPDYPKEQLELSIEAVFKSWNTERAIIYRKINKIPEDWGTAVNVQTMVFGNLSQDSGTGVAFTRDPSTGANLFYGEYLMNAQGEDVVAGIRTPQPLKTLQEANPQIYAELDGIRQKLEQHYKEMQDIEFTIQKGKLYMLQTRKGKRTAEAEVCIAVSMVKEGLIDKKTAVARVKPEQVEQLLHPRLDPKAELEVIAKGLPASPGAAVGRVVFTAADAERWVTKGEKVILVREQTSPEDIGGMNASQGILTATGGMTSHAAVVARGMGKPCVAGCGSLQINERTKKVTISDKSLTLSEGDYISLDGSAGRVILGQVKLIAPEMSGDFRIMMDWADEIRKLKVRTNADTPRDAKIARDFGAQGIGLTRTEHMFFEGDRIDAVREMILAQDLAGRQKALAKLLPMQREDFIGIFRAMAGLPVTIRLLDPPLHEFLPHKDEEIKQLSEKIGVSEEILKAKVDSLHEFNPMLGHRGCRLGISYPEISFMQARAIFEAACQVKKEGLEVYPEVMVPLVGHVKELELQKEVIDEAAKTVMAEQGIKIEYTVGTMIEIPRAALTADKIAQVADFFSFGTNDLTQMTFGLSRDDAGFLPEYVEKKIWAADPFQILEQEGVGQLISIGVQKGRSTKPKLKIGICGEHGGEPNSVKFCHRTGFDYVSCSPYRVPVARLAAAHAVLEEEGKI